VGVSQQLITRALAEVSSLDAAIIAGRLMGEWQATPEFYSGLTAPEGVPDHAQTEGVSRSEGDTARPYPFCLAYPLEDAPETLGEIALWQAEWKWDGIRAQLIRREAGDGARTFLWSRGEDLITERFPEIAEVGERLPPGTVIDGEILPFREGAFLAFMALQQRIGRKTLTKKILSDVPVILVAYDLLEWEGRDWRGQPLSHRRAQLEQVVQQVAMPTLRPSPVIAVSSWPQLAAARERSREQNAEGVMLKRLDSAYKVGRQRGDWWKWKIAPYTIDAVLVYAQRGSGKRASLYTDYTFAVWDVDAGSGERHLVPFAKAYSGLTDAEIRKVDHFVRQNTLEKFGPVRTVTPQLVFELAFEGIQRSTRHKSGIAVRFPRILRWRDDKTIEDADTLDTIQAMLSADK
jgi:DNA ligase-1